MASSWLNQSRDDRKSKTRPRNKHQIIRRSKPSSVHESQEEPRSERDVIRLRNPTEDNRAFRRMLTSADRWKRSAILFFFLGVVLGSNQERRLEIRVVLGVRLPKMSRATVHYYSCKSAVPVIAVIGVIAVVAVVVVAVVAVVSVVPVVSSCNSCDSCNSCSKVINYFICMTASFYSIAKACM